MSDQTLLVQRVNRKRRCTQRTEADHLARTRSSRVANHRIANVVQVRTVGRENKARSGIREFHLLRRSTDSPFAGGGRQVTTIGSVAASGRDLRAY